MRIRSSVLTAVGLALAVVHPLSAQDQGRRITGQIIDKDDKAPVPSVLVTVTGYTISAITNDAGKFTLRNVPAGATGITTRRIGYVSAAVKLVADQEDYTISLAHDVLHLEQQVITGIATTTSSKNSTTDDKVLSSDQLNGAPTATVEEALQGKVPGAVIEANSGAPGGGLQLQLRGITSIYGTNAVPLYVVDGVITTNLAINSGLNALTSAGSGGNGGPTPGMQDQSVNRIADLNPADIESVEVMESAAASAIYGDKAAAGVVLITTKHGQAGKPQINASQKFGTFNLNHEVPTLHVPLSLAYTQGAAAGLSKADVLANYNECNGFCDFQKSLYGGGQLSYESDVSITGGSDNTQYFLSGLAKYDNGIELNTGYNKQSARANVVQHFGSTITGSVNITYAADQTRRGINGNDNLGISGYDNLAYAPSWYNMAAHLASGRYVPEPFGFNGNAYDVATRSRTPEVVNRFIGGANLDWKVFSSNIQQLDIVAQGGADHANIHDQFYVPPDEAVEANASYLGVATFQASYIQNTNYSVSLVHRLTGVSGLNATTSIGLTRDKVQWQQSDNVGEGLPLGQAQYTFGIFQVPYQHEEETNNQAFYGQEQLLLFGDKLSLTGGVNAERSSNNGGINRYYLFPKGGASYRIPNLASVVDELKLRFAYGQAGTVPNYGVKFNEEQLALINGINGERFGTIVGDPNIRPEVNTGLETGFDLTMFKSRAQFSATVYQKRITNLLLQAGLAPSTGATNQWINGGQITDEGLDLSITARPIQIGAFSWQTNENFGRNYARVDNLPIPSFTAGSAFGQGNYRVQVGASPTAIWVNNPGQVQWGNAEPAFTMGFGNEFNFGPLHLHTFLDLRRGQSTINLTQNYYDSFGNSPDTSAETFRLNHASYAYVQDASFLKLREVTLRYDLPARFVRTAGQGWIRTAALSVSGRNLRTWTKYVGPDPEVSNFGTQLLGRGQDVTPYPPWRSYFIGIDLGL
ncbi:MAG TPA: TonB-dependent receptor plug domain-containing protein [Gemmatimonadaceae bacterium]|nr:TonB-dependent receptor plug domain-containing protein [Gemmatimonadaceae bacterium]